MKGTLKWRVAQTLERKWWVHYLRNQSPEEYRAWKEAYWQRVWGLVKGIVPLSESDTVLDAGCGPAGMFSIFGKNAVTAIDPLLDKYEQDLAVFSKSDYPNVNFVTDTMEGFQPDEPFDLVCCMNAINHVSDLQLAFDRLGSFCRPSGYCLLSIDAHNHGFLKHLFRAIPGDALHPHQFDLEEYKGMFERVGFEQLGSFLLKKHPIFDYHLLVGKKKVI